MRCEKMKTVAANVLLLVIDVARFKDTEQFCTCQTKVTKPCASVEYRRPILHMQLFRG
jgi:hypothetical protein